VLHLSEINISQCTAWCQTIEAFDEDSQQARQIALFPEERQAPALNCDVVHVRLGGLRLDQFWPPRLPASREGTRRLDVLKTLVVRLPPD
jgi:hypothetical protein